MVADTDLRSRLDMPQRTVLATVLTAMAGFMDAVGFIPLGHLYLSFMSGNSTHLGLSLAGGDRATALTAAGVVAAFVAGVSAGTFITDAFKSLRIVLAAELLIFLMAIALLHIGLQKTALILIASAMGMQNTLHQVVAKADIGRGFISGNLFSLGQALARISSDAAEAGRAALNAASWLTFVSGVILGALAFAAFGLAACLWAIAIAIICLIFATSMGWL